MNKSDLKEYLANGYDVSPYQIEDIEECSEIYPIILDKKAFLDNLTDANIGLHFSLMSIAGSFVVYKAYIDEAIHITPAVLLKRIKDFKKELSQGIIRANKITKWANSLDRLYNKKKCYFPTGDDFLDEKLRLIYLPDYMFSNDDHLVSYVLYRLKNELNENNAEIELDNDITFMEEIIDMKEEKESYSLSEISLAYMVTVTKYLKDDEYHTLMDDTFRRMYQINLSSLAANTDIAMCSKELGDNYFYPRFGFKKNLAKALSNYLKAYQIEPSSYLALRLGDIYDAMDEDESISKAYQYYSISYLTDQNNEATYKLADLFSLGRGVEANLDLSLDLLIKKTDDLIEQYRLSTNSDLFLFATRLAIIYLNRNNVNHLDEAKTFLLLGRDSFKERYHYCKKDIDVGYITVIEKNIDFIKRHTNYSNRLLSKKGGYILNKNTYIEFSNVDVECLKKDHNYYYLNIQNKDHSPLLIRFNEIFFIEKSRIARFIVKISDEDFSIDDLYNAKSLRFTFGILHYTDNDTGISDFINIDELIYCPSFSYDALYNVVSLYSSFNDETYYFLSDKKYDINSKMIIIIDNEEINCVVKDNLLLYEDELPLLKDDLIELSIVTKR